MAITVRGDALVLCRVYNGEFRGSGVVASWTYPIRLGDARAKAHELLGNPTRSTEVLEEYPLSGITLWFDSEGRVSKVNLQGTASALYTGGAVSLLSHRALAFGLTAHSRDGDFARILGMPVTEIQEGPSERREVRRLWRKEWLSDRRNLLGCGSRVWRENVSERRTSVGRSVSWHLNDASQGLRQRDGQGPKGRPRRAARDNLEPPVQAKTE